MSITIHTGDIFDVQADALVIPANTQPDLGWGSHISERVKGMAAPSVMEEREKAGTLSLGKAFLTSGEGTPFHCLVHAAVLDKYDFNPLFLLRLRQRTSDDTLISALRSVREIIEKKNIARTAVSAMGAGIGGMNYRKCVRITFGELKDMKAEIIFAAYRKKHALIAQKELET